MDTPITFWIIFNAFVLVMLALDLGVFHRKSHEVSVREALTWTFIWVFLALLFNVTIYFWKGQQQALEFFTGYLVEKALSVDNILVLYKSEWVAHAGFIFAKSKIKKCHDSRRIILPSFTGTSPLVYNRNEI